MLKLQDIVREVFDACAKIATQRLHSEPIGTRSATNTKINPIRVESGKRAKLLRHQEWCVVGQHNAARTHPNSLRSRRQVSHHYGRGRARNAGHIVVFRNPVSVVSPGLRLNRKLLAALERATRITALCNRN